MKWYKSDIVTIDLISEQAINRRRQWRAVITWANMTEESPRFYKRKCARAWAARRVCNRLGDEALYLVEKEGEAVLTW
jgi:hypothetical protein